MSYIASWYWDRGGFREKNEDSFSLQKIRLKHSEAAMLVVCDGIGGLPEGESASGFVAEQLTEWFYREGVVCLNRFFWRKRTVDAICGAFYEIQQKLELCERQEGICCGTTCTMALAKGSRFLLLHSGDSRAYLVGRRERRLTHDHHQKNALNRCVGAFGFQMPDVVKGRLRKGSVLVLCTDGFCQRMPAGFFKGSLPEGDAALEAYYKSLKGMGSFVKAQGEKDNLTAVMLKNAEKG